MTILPTKPFARQISALFLAPVAPCLIIFLAGFPGGILNSLGFSALLLCYGEALAFVIGLPALIILRRIIRPRLIYTMIAGGMIANAPWAFLAVMGLIAAIHAPLVEVFTLPMVAMAAAVVFGTFCLGAFGGAVFWAIATQRWLGETRK